MDHLRRLAIVVSCAILCLSALVACATTPDAEPPEIILPPAGTDDPGTTGGTPETSLEESFCARLSTGPETEVVAANTVAEAPEVFLDDDGHVEIDIPLNGGIVKFTPDEEGTFALGFGEDLEISIIKKPVNVLARVERMPFFNPPRKTASMLEETES